MPEIASPRRTTPTGWSVRRDDALAAQAYKDGWWQAETAAHALVRAARDTPDRILLIDGDTSLTAATLHAQATRLAQAMLARFTPGSAISFMLPNWHEAAIIYMGATLAGMVANPILPSLRDHDLRFILADLNSAMIFIPASFRGHDYAAMLTRVTPALGSPPAVIVLRGDAGQHIAFADLLAETGDAPFPTVDPDDVRMVMYTSGTTGRPKGVLHSHNSINALIRQIGRHWLVEPGDHFLVPSPVSHIGGSIYAFETPLLLGTTAILMEYWNPDEAVAIMTARHCTHMAGATPFLQHLLASARAAETRLPDLKLFICGGASVPPSLIRDAAAYFDKAIVSRVYGSTELPVTTVGVIDPADRDHAADTDGRAGIATIRIAPDGEIRARGPQMMVGYLHPEDEEGSFDADGYYRSGDQGAWIDGDHLVVTGRIKDLIIRNGENIAPKEIEDLLIGHPGILEIAIVGIPDPRTGERAVAVIVPSGDATPDVPAIADFLGQHGVARFKYPESVVLRDALPKNDAGKVLKAAIRATLTAS
ncbi:Long-chain-fatty-acid--CoA ligase [Sphingobium indicum BiD32]|uniref:Long-chain-fatty-acid--CoA ligase n=1 Tax=Sphingobium indicum BiD32 TaxID=1301087 RepID=N1MSJ8_9SPHN|nr:AMP-binding protein [Sphingobium indicum]CCW19961.1 Long-chain-fatty-acid--CoA ligase [Sphingobium indicum BiD32]